jgi:ubiquinone/menaquinone biosynthesis C-methylase UbiE
MHKQSIYLETWYAEEYDRDRFGGAFGRYIHDQEVETFLSMINGFQGSVLDVGAGTGKLTLPLMCQSREVVSVDFSSEMLKVAVGKAEKQGVIPKSIACDVHNLCFQDKTFECVISSRVLMHLTDWRRGLSELCRVAKGVVVVDFPPLRSFAGAESLYRRLKRRLLSETRAYRALPISGVIRELERNDFRIAGMRKQFFLPIAFHRRLNRPRASLAVEQACRAMGLVRLMGAPVTVKAVRSKSPSMQSGQDINEREREGDGR